MNPRLNRLKRDYEKLQELAARSPFVTIHSTEGNPPEKYILHLTCKGIREIAANQMPIFSESHYLSIDLHDNYPRKGPRFQILAEKTPVVHPNITANGQICIGDAGDHGWSPAMGLDDIIIRIIQMIRYENVGLKSAFNWEAAKWAAKNQQLFPLDTRQIVGEELLEITLIDNVTIVHQSQVDDDLLDEIVIF